MSITSSVFSSINYFRFIALQKNKARQEFMSRVPYMWPHNDPTLIEHSLDCGTWRLAHSVLLGLADTAYRRKSDCGSRTARCPPRYLACRGTSESAADCCWNLESTICWCSWRRASFAWVEVHNIVLVVHAYSLALHSIADGIWGRRMLR